MSNPARPERQDNCTHQGACLPGEHLTSPAADPTQDTTTVGGPALPGWDSELEDAVEFAHRIGRL